MSATIAVFILLLAAGAPAQPDPLAAATRYADAFLHKAEHAISVETLHQTSFRYPPHGLVTIDSPDLVRARFLKFEVVSEYMIGRLKDADGAELVELREVVSLNGHAVKPIEAARRTLWEDARKGEDAARKHLLATFTRLGLVDVATDYGLILLAFTTAGQRQLRIQRAGEEFVGTEEAVRFHWEQSAGGALEFRGRKVARRAQAGSIWLRKSDGMPLRISAWFEHAEPHHVLRDDATVDYVASALGFPTPVTVVHRHSVDGQAITENLYTYAPFRVFASNTRIRYGQATEPVKK